MPQRLRLSVCLRSSAGGHIEEFGDVGSQAERKWQRDGGDFSAVYRESDGVVGPDFEAPASQCVGKCRLP